MKTLNCFYLECLLPCAEVLSVVAADLQHQVVQRVSHRVHRVNCEEGMQETVYCIANTY